jgi:hypothetical protein
MYQVVYSKDDIYELRSFPEGIEITHGGKVIQPAEDYDK